MYIFYQLCNKSVLDSTFHKCVFSTSTLLLQSPSIAPYRKTCRSKHIPTPDQIDYILCSQRWRSSILSAKTRLGADCGSDHEHLITNFRLKLKKAGQRLREFSQENALVIANPCSNNTREDSTHGHHQMVNTEIRLVIFFAAKDGEALYSQQKQDWELTVPQVMNSLLSNSD